MESLMTVQDVAEYMKIGETTARALVRSLPHICVGKNSDRGLLRIRESVLEAFIRGEIERDEPTPAKHDPYYGLGPVRKRGRPRKA